SCSGSQRARSESRGDGSPAALGRSATAAPSATCRSTRRPPQGAISDGIGTTGQEPECSTLEHGFHHSEWARVNVLYRAAPSRPPRLPKEHVGVANRDGGLKSPETIPGLPIVPGHAVGVLLTPLDLPRLAGRHRLQNQSASSD